MVDTHASPLEVFKDHLLLLGYFVIHLAHILALRGKGEQLGRVDASHAVCHSFDVGLGRHDAIFYQVSDWDLAEANRY